MKLPGFAADTSITVNVERSGATWTFKFQPQPIPQVKLAVPLPLALSDWIVNESPLKLPVPHAECETPLTLVATPLAFKVKVYRVVPNPQPVSPMMVICQFPAKSAGTTFPVAKPGLLTAKRVITESATEKISRVTRLV